MNSNTKLYTLFHVYKQKLLGHLLNIFSFNSITLYIQQRWHLWLGYIAAGFIFKTNCKTMIFIKNVHQSLHSWLLSNWRIWHTMKKSCIDGIHTETRMSNITQKICAHELQWETWHTVFTTFVCTVRIMCKDGCGQARHGSKYLGLHIFSFNCRWESLYSK